MVQPSTVERYLEDASGYTGQAERVVVPADLGELREIVLTCRDRSIPLTVSGAGTGLTGARVPHGGWVLSLERFRTLDIHKGVAHCGPGVLLSELAKAAAETRQFLGPNPTETSAAIGGVVSTNAGGARSFRYGSLRRHVLAMEVTFMSGETRTVRRGDEVEFPYKIVRAPATTKNSAGYYLQPDLEWVDLIAGSEGTLAVVSAVDLRLLPEPAAILSGVVFFREDARAMDAVETWRSVPELRLLEYMDERALSFLRPHYPHIPAETKAALLIEQNLTSENDDEVDRWSERMEAVEADQQASWFGFSTADQERFREFRHLLPVMVIDKVRRNGFPKFGTDFAVPIENGRQTHEYFRRECQERVPGRFTIFGHVGDANNHINLLPESKEDAAVCEKLIDDCARHVIAQGGTIAAEHGIGKSKTNLLRMMYSPEEIEAMRNVKRHLDPQWLLGQGNIFEL